MRREIGALDTSVFALDLSDFKTVKSEWSHDVQPAERSIR